MEPRPLRHYVEGEYATLDLPVGWHVASLLCFAAALGSRLLVVLLLPARWPSSWMRPLLPGLAGLLFAVLGLAFGLLGLRNARGRSLARVGVFLNSIVLVLSLLAALAFFVILRR
jgi:hypothetical protein